MTENLYVDQVGPETEKQVLQQQYLPCILSILWDELMVTKIVIFYFSLLWLPHYGSAPYRPLQGSPEPKRLGCF